MLRNGITEGTDKAFAVAGAWDAGAEAAAIEDFTASRAALPAVRALRLRFCVPELIEAIGRLALPGLLGFAGGAVQL